MFIKRLGQNGRQLCSTGAQCSQILEMQTGDYAVVGQDITDAAKAAMLPGAGVGPNERVVMVPRRVFVDARPEIPSAA